MKDSMFNEEGYICMCGGEIFSFTKKVHKCTPKVKKLVNQPSSKE